ncbi:MAG: LysM peptidoglycan-binding domain-containing protein [Bacteroidales bacterium]|jgi:LysM repeat protein
MRKIIIFILINFIFSVVTFSQEVKQKITRSAQTEVISGKKYYIHKIEKGQTLSTIAQAYSVKVDEIKKANPELKKKLKEGETIKIPFISKISQPKSEENFLTHEVEQGETLYNISKQYGISVDEIKRVNPDIADVIKEGQILNIPVTTKIPEKYKKQKENAITDTNRKKITKSELKVIYDVALMVPFNLQYADEIKINDNPEENIASNQKSFLFIGFYEGALIAIDSLKKTGMNLKIHVYEVNDDSVQTLGILRKPELQKMDLIIGPLFETPFKIVAGFAKKYEIKIVSPLTSENKVLENNPFVFKATPSMMVQLELYASYIAKKIHSTNLVIVYNDNNENEKIMLQKFKTVFKNTPDSSGKCLVATELPYNKSGLSGLDKIFIKDTQNVLLILSNNQIFVSNLITSLCSRYEIEKPNKKEDEPPEFTSRIEDFKIKVLGLSGWRHFDNMEITYLVKLYLQLYSTTFVDYEQENVKDFVIKYRDRFKTEPHKYAFVGFDICFYFLKALKDYGVNFQNNLNNIKTNPLQNKYIYQKTENNGFENKYINIFKYEDYKQIKVN